MHSSESTKIVVLDGYTLNPGDLDWSGLESIGDVQVFDRTDPADVVARIGDASVVLTNKVIVDAAIIKQCPCLKYIGVLATGFNVVDLDAAREHGVTVTNVPGYSTESVAQLVFAHILHFTHRVAEHAQSVRDGEWERSEDFSYSIGALCELDQMTMGLVGFGQIGQSVARIAQAFGMKVRVYKPNIPAEPVDGIEFVSKEVLFRTSDVLSLHCPLNNETKLIINKSSLEMMKSTALLINTGRGDLVHEADLRQALLTGVIAGAGLDVATIEPMSVGHPLKDLNNCNFTPHIGWATLAARERLMDLAVGNVRSFLDGSAVNIVS